MWWIRAGIDPERLIDAAPGGERAVLHVRVPDARRSRFWFLATPGDVSLCFTDPGFDVDVTLESPLGVLYQIWLGALALPRRGAQRPGHAHAAAREAVRRLPDALKLSPARPVRRAGPGTARPIAACVTGAQHIRVNPRATPRRLWHTSPRDRPDQPAARRRLLSGVLSLLVAADTPRPRPTPPRPRPARVCDHLMSAPELVPPRSCPRLICAATPSSSCTPTPTTRRSSPGSRCAGWPTPGRAPCSSSPRPASWAGPGCRCGPARPSPSGASPSWSGPPELLGVSRLVLLGHRDSGLPGWAERQRTRRALAAADPLPLARRVAELADAEGAGDDRPRRRAGHLRPPRPPRDLPDRGHRRRAGRGDRLPDDRRPGAPARQRPRRAPGARGGAGGRGAVRPADRGDRAGRRRRPRAPAHQAGRDHRAREPGRRRTTCPPTASPPPTASSGSAAAPTRPVGRSATPTSSLLDARLGNAHPSLAGGRPSLHRRPSGGSPAPALDRRAPAAAVQFIRWPPRPPIPSPPSRRPTPAGGAPGGRWRRTWPGSSGPPAAGCCCTSSFPPRTLWWLALPAFALLGLVLHGRRARGPGFGYGRPVRPRVPAAAAGLDRQSRRAGAVGGAVRGRGAVRRPGRRRDALVVPAAGRAGVGGARSGWPARRCAAGCRSAGCPWGRVGFGQPDGPLLPAGGDRRRAAAVVRHRAGRARARRAGAPAGRRRAAARGRWRRPRCSLVLALVAGPLAALVPPHGRRRPGARRDDRRRAGQRAAPRPGLQRPAPRGARQPRAGHRAARRRRRRRPPAAAGPGDLAGELLATSTRCATPTRPPRSTGPPAAIEAPDPGRRGAASNPDGRTTSNSALVWEPGVGAGRAQTTSAGCSRSASTCRGGSSSALFSSYVDRAGYFVPGPGPGAVDMAGVRVGRRDLLGGRVRRPGRRQRRRRRPGARGAEQQRHLRAAPR